jgi:hypothetical protein
MSDVANRWKIQVDDRNAQPSRRQRRPAPFCARMRRRQRQYRRRRSRRHGELDSREMNNIAPNQEPIAAGLDKRGVVTRCVARSWKRSHTLGDVVGFHCADSVRVGVKRRRSGQQKVSSTFGRCAFHCPVVSPDAISFFVHDQLGALENVTSVGVRLSSFVIGMHMSYQYGVDV